MSPRLDSHANDLRLALYSGPSGDIITLADYLALEPAQRSALDVTPSSTCLSLVIDGQEHWGPNLNLGALGLLAEQFPQAQQRLERGERALIRAVGFDSDISEYVLFDPKGDGTVLAAILATDVLEPQLWLPHRKEGADLYQFVAQHFDEMLAMGYAQRSLPSVSAYLDLIASALGREARLATQVTEIIGPGSF